MSCGSKLVFAKGGNSKDTEGIKVSVSLNAWRLEEK